MHGQRIGYVRVSSIDQNPERQLEQIPLDQVFTDQASGKDTQRPELERLLGFVRETDTVVVHSMDRLARNLDDLRRIVGKLTGRGVRIEFVKENLTFTGEDSPMANLMLSVMGAFAEFEAGLAPGTAARGRRPGQAARGLPGPQENALAGAGGPAPPTGPGRRGKDTGGGRVRHQPANPLPIPAHRRLTMTRRRACGVALCGLGSRQGSTWMGTGSPHEKSTRMGNHDQRGPGQAAPASDAFTYV